MADNIITNQMISEKIDEVKEILSQKIVGFGSLDPKISYSMRNNDTIEGQVKAEHNGTNLVIPFFIKNDTLYPLDLISIDGIYKPLTQEVLERIFALEVGELAKKDPRQGREVNIIDPHRVLSGTQVGTAEGEVSSFKAASEEPDDLKYIYLEKQGINVIAFDDVNKEGKLLSMAKPESAKDVGMESLFDHYKEASLVGFNPGANSYMNVLRPTRKVTVINMNKAIPEEVKPLEGPHEGREVIAFYGPPSEIKSSTFAAYKLFSRDGYMFISGDKYFTKLSSEVPATAFREKKSKESGSLHRLFQLEVLNSFYVVDKTDCNMFGPLKLMSKKINLPLDKTEGISFAKDITYQALDIFSGRMYDIVESNICKDEVIISDSSITGKSISIFIPARSTRVEALSFGDGKTPNKYGKYEIIVEGDSCIIDGVRCDAARDALVKLLEDGWDKDSVNGIIDYIFKSDMGDKLAIDYETYFYGDPENLEKQASIEISEEVKTAFERLVPEIELCMDVAKYAEIDMIDTELELSDVRDIGDPMELVMAIDVIIDSLCKYLMLKRIEKLNSPDTDRVERLIKDLMNLQGMLHRDAIKHEY